MSETRENSTTILVTGAAGFVGSSVAESLLKRGERVLGIDDLNTYYDPTLKQARLERLQKYPQFRFEKTDIADRAAMTSLTERERPARIVHMAAQAGVRYSLENPHAYIDSNITGFLNILEMARHLKVDNLVFASSSSVYGSSTDIPFRLDQRADEPISLYGATKRSNELMAHAYCHLFGFPAVGLRFFTVYGPWGRPDMAYFSFTKRILERQPIEVYNFGHHRRDFTYIDDVVRAVISALDHPAKSPDLFKVYNVGNSSPMNLSDLISAIEEATGVEAKKEFVAQKPGDALDTYADVSEFEKDFGFKPKTNLKDGIRNFVSWYRDFYARS